MIKQKAGTRVIAEKTIYAVFLILRDAGPLPGKEVIDTIKKTVSFSEYENYIYAKTGYVRWQSVLHFYTIDCMKAGLLIKENGIWSLTQEGINAIELGPEKLFELSRAKYKEWSNNRENVKQDIIEKDPELHEGQNQLAILNQFEDKAAEGIRECILNKTPYEFQNLVSYLLSAMGYFISHIAEKGPDGGIDIIAYTDPLGTKEPRLIVQVKHRPEAKVPSEDIQKLVGTMKRSSDVGIFVTSGQFSTPATKEARSSHKHIELIDFGRFIKLWQEHYHKMNDEQRNGLPLKAIYFLGTNE
jgi:restriction system protein